MCGQRLKFSMVCDNVEQFVYVKQHLPTLSLRVAK